MPAPPEALIAELATHPGDRELLQVFADWLLEHGHPSGELMVLELAAERTGEPAARAGELVTMRLEPYLRQLLGRELDASYAWRCGLLDAITLHHGVSPAAVAETLRRLAGDPATRLLQRITIVAVDDDGTGDLAPALAELARLARAFPRLSELAIHGPGDGDRLADGGRMPVAIGDLAALCAAYPRLAILELGGKAYTLGDLALPALRRLVIHDVTAAVVADLARAPLALLEELELLVLDAPLPSSLDRVFGPLLDRTLPRLRAITIGVELRVLMPYFVRAVPASNLARHVQVLGFRRGMLDDDCVRTLVAWAPRLRALARVEVEGRGLSPHHQRALRQALGPVLVVR